MKTKRFAWLLLALFMLFSTVSCSVLESEVPSSAETLREETAETEEVLETGPITIPEGFSVGYAKKACNPDEGTGLGGYGTEGGRFSERILDDIMITCTALSDGENIFLFIGLDTLSISVDLIDSFAKRVTKMYPELSIPKENIIMNATHSHTAPAIHSGDAANIGQYMKKFYPVLYFVTEKALRTLSPATIEYASANTEGLNYVRRYVTPDGKTYLGNWPEPMSPLEGRHETQPDTQMQLLRFRREEGKDVILCNWQCHPCSNIAGEAKTLVSADWVGSMRKYVEQNMGVEFAYFQGAAGNLVSSTRILGEKTNSDYVKKGKELAEVVERAMENTTLYEAGSLRAIRKEIAYKSGSLMYLSVLSIGEIAIATVPCEYHDSLGVQVKENSPFKKTLFFGYTNGSHGYIPASFAFELGGYEVESTRYERGTGEKMAEDLLTMLREIK